MKKLFSSIKNATTQFAKGLFSSKEETTQQGNRQDITSEEQIQQYDDQIKSYLDSQKELKVKILTNRNHFNNAVLELSWRKLLDIKNLYANERRINFQPKLVILEQQHWERIVIQVAELIQSYYDIQIYYDRQELIRIVLNNFILQIKQKVLEEQCIKILFSKEEMKDYFQFYEQSDVLLIKFKQQFPQLALEYSQSQIKEIQKQYLIDKAFDQFKFDECDEYKGIKLFHDDEEVLKWFKRKQAIAP
ncbi:unnamed protein product [Paramecium sonneborni]|uniref:Uncharacterized protein n=1 Tax=Paramecium sonneborni TaxID=65129 RepID=A0A8S1M1I4_9CILI|nr:unnamed protein product [Paramecium sonneborni]